ncbi:hypothetical protein PVAP13_3KG176935 [Panicum virgatum]|uniref:Uncharacterized protein n=1 Tax=Panicum virgatum TaxID=38727 RepID=A0A8T0URS2_PANVG|nr:hypothetical protein PVAP13_3KG176935 [Panicum virgatum]
MARRDSGRVGEPHVRRSTKWPGSLKERPAGGGVRQVVRAWKVHAGRLFSHYPWPWAVGLAESSLLHDVRGVLVGCQCARAKSRGHFSVEGQLEDVT